MRDAGPARRSGGADFDNRDIGNEARGRADRPAPGSDFSGSRSSDRRGLQNPAAGCDTSVTRHRRRFEKWSELAGYGGAGPPRAHRPTGGRRSCKPEIGVRVPVGPPNWGVSSTVSCRIVNPVILVRVQAPQPFDSHHSGDVLDHGRPFTRSHGGRCKESSAPTVDRGITGASPVGRPTTHPGFGVGWCHVGQAPTSLPEGTATEDGPPNCDSRRP